MAHRLNLIIGFSAWAAVALVCAAADPLDPVFAHMDAAAKTFKGMTADISDTQYTALVNENDVQTGVMRLLRVKPDTTRLWAEFSKPGGGESISLDEHSLRAFNHKTNVVDEFDTSAKKGLVNQYLLLGFGATSAELKASYDVTWVGTDKINGQSASRIALIPKSPDARRDLKQADLWIGENGLVVQQKFLQPSGNYKLVTYSNMKLRSMPEKDLELKLPKGVTIQQH